MTYTNSRKIPRCSRCGSKEHNKRKCQKVYPSGTDLDALHLALDAHGRAIDAIQTALDMLVAQVRSLQLAAPRGVEALRPTSPLRGSDE